MRALCVLVLASLVYSSLSLPSNLRRKLLQGGSGTQQSCADIVNKTTPNEELSNVKVQVYMMSACKAGQAALGALLPSVTSCPSLTLHVDFIGHGTAQQGFSSTLGRNDVIGDVYMLCAQRIFATKAVAPMAIPYFKCLIENGDDDLAVYGETCKSKVGSTDFQEAVYRCVRSRTISFALEESFKKAAEAKAVISPTIFVNDEPYCGPRTKLAFEDAIAKAMQGIGMKQFERGPNDSHFWCTSWQNTDSLSLFGTEVSIRQTRRRAGAATLKYPREIRWSQTFPASVRPKTVASGTDRVE